MHCYRYITLWPGFTGASILKKKELEMQKSRATEEYSLTEQKTVQKSKSLPENLKNTKKELWHMPKCDTNDKNKKKNACSVV